MQRSCGVVTSAKASGVQDYRRNIHGDIHTKGKVKPLPHFTTIWTSLHIYGIYMFISFHTIYIHTQCIHINTYFYQLTSISPFENVSFAIVLSKYFTYLGTSHHISFPNCIFFSPKMEISWSYQPPDFCIFFVVTDALHFSVTRIKRKCVDWRHPPVH